MYIIDGKNKIELRYAKTYLKRLIGFMFKKNINYCLCFPKCKSIHTFFMRNRIDVYMTDKNNIVLYKYKDFKKYRVILPKQGVDKVFEFPVDKVNFEIGEKIKIED